MTTVQDRRLLMFFEATRSHSRHGSCKYCNKLTHDGKDECVEHLSKRPYVAALLQTMKQHEKETARIEKQGIRAVDPQGLHVSEILSDLNMHGPKTIAGLSRSTQFSQAVVSTCVKKMKLMHLVRLFGDSRGNVVVALSGPKVRLARTAKLK